MRKLMAERVSFIMTTLKEYNGECTTRFLEWKFHIKYPDTDKKLLRPAIRAAKDEGLIKTRTVWDVIEAGMTRRSQKILIISIRTVKNR